jgi:uncharacterized protein (TIGR02597 family)
MNILRPSIYAIALTSLALPSLNAQTTATTDPVGFTTLTVRGKATPTSPNVNSFVSLNMARPTAFQGTVGIKSLDGSGRTVITFTGTPFTANQFNGIANAHYVQLTGGSNDGLVSEVVATTSNSLTLVDDINSVITDNTTTFKVVPYWTLSTAFPNGGGLNGGASATPADAVTILPPTGNALAYFYNTSANQWRRGTSDSSNVIIPPGAGLLITRKIQGNVSITLAGAVNLGPTEAVVGAASPTAVRNTMLANPYPLPSVTLANSGLYTGNPTTGVAGGASATAADAVVILDPATGNSLSYFYNTSANQWRRGTTDSSNVVIPEGAAVLVTRKAGRGEFSWYIPQPNMNL